MTKPDFINGMDAIAESVLHRLEMHLQDKYKPATRETLDALRTWDAEVDGAVHIDAKFVTRAVDKYVRELARVENQHGADKAQFSPVAAERLLDGLWPHMHGPLTREIKNDVASAISARLEELKVLFEKTQGEHTAAIVGRTPAGRGR